MTLPGASSIPAADSNHLRMAAASGRRIVDMVWEDLTPQRVLTAAAFENALTATMALGGSTNALIHLTALARRAGHADFGLVDVEAVSRRVPVLANIRPSGERYLMEDFYEAGGLRALLMRVDEYLHGTCLTANGRTLAENLDGAEVADDDVIRPLGNPVYGGGALAVLRGNLAPDGAVMKPAACEPRLRHHTGPALVFASYAELEAEIDRDDLEVTPETVLVLQNGGPQGGPGMPEWGMLPIPKKLLARGVRDMVRLSDARMSGTSYGACIVHVAPESFVGGPLALVRTGDRITVDVDRRRLQLEVSDDELTRRRAAWIPPLPRYHRGYGALFARHIRQADAGCDFDILETQAGAPVDEPAIF
jgi:dihydroxy-acid dehydratase